MTIYRCPCGEEEKKVLRAKIIYRDKKWVADVLCECGKYMESKPAEGMPQIVRTEQTLSKRRKKIIEGTKERLCGERGINEDFN